MTTSQQNTDALKDQLLESIKHNPAYFQARDVLKQLLISDESAVNLIVSEVMNSLMHSERDYYLKEHPDSKPNGFYDRTLTTKSDTMNINVPRTRSGEFRPQILPDKYQRYLDDYKEFVINLIVTGNSQSQIKAILSANGQIYSPEAFDEIYGNLKMRLNDFKSRELPHEFVVIFIDGKRVSIKANNKVVDAVIYTFIGVSFDGSKQIIDFFIEYGSESSEKWKEILNSLINRGLKKVLLFVSDNLSGLKNTITALFPKSHVQLCLIHLMRNAHRNMSKEDAKEFNDRLHALSTAQSSFDDDYAKKRFEDFITDKKTTYKPFMEKLSSDLSAYLAFMKFPVGIRKYIYSTNQIECINKQIEKIQVRQEGYFQSQENLELNMFILASRLLVSWTTKRRNPFYAHYSYELRQMFNLAFFEENTKPTNEKGN
jgi:transposase-like protein